MTVAMNAEVMVMIILKMKKEMEEELLRRARFLVVCGNRITEEMKDDITIEKKAKLIVTSMEGITGYI